MLAIALIAGFMLIVLVMLLSYVLATSGMEIAFPLSIFHTYHLEVMILVSVLGLVIGASVYFLMHEQVIVKTQEAAGNAHLLLTFLSPEERAVVELLVDSEGHTTQAQLSKMMSRLKAHRTVLRLEKRKIIRIEKLGKTNQLWLTQSIYDALRNGKHSEESKAL
ncbi:hypothetical protein KJ780_00580 [Candidatus Micrarchaeota archaeon]|nr:hypothetical protein [Candidatus Micrarchaeota archaeon]